MFTAIASHVSRPKVCGTIKKAVDSGAQSVRWWSVASRFIGIMGRGEISFAGELSPAVLLGFSCRWRR